MGSPDYPGEEDHTFQPPLGQSLPMHGIHNSDNEADSDDSMPPGFQQNANLNDPDDPYNNVGYQPLNFEPMAADDDSSSDDDESDDENNAEVVSLYTIHLVKIKFSHFNLWSLKDQQPTGSEAIVETTAEREILREIWNAPRPAELDIELDTNKAEEVSSVRSYLILIVEFQSS